MDLRDDSQSAMRLALGFWCDSLRRLRNEHNRRCRFDPRRHSGFEYRRSDRMQRRHGQHDGHDVELRPDREVGVHGEQQPLQDCVSLSVGDV